MACDFGKDLEIRGPGEVLGTKQTGIAEFKVANLMRDRKMIPTVQHYAKALIVKYPDVAESLIHRWLIIEKFIRMPKVRLFLKEFYK